MPLDGGWIPAIRSHNSWWNSSSTTYFANEVLLLSSMKYYSYRQWSTTPIANEVLLLSPMKYYSDFNRFRFTPFLLFYETASPSFYSLTEELCNTRKAFLHDKNHAFVGWTENTAKARATAVPLHPQRLRWQNQGRGRSGEAGLWLFAWPAACSREWGSGGAWLVRHGEA